MGRICFIQVRLALSASGCIIAIIIVCILEYCFVNTDLTYWVTSLNGLVRTVCEAFNHLLFAFKLSKKKFQNLKLGKKCNPTRFVINQNYSSSFKNIQIGLNRRFLKKLYISHIYKYKLKCLHSYQ